MAVKAVEVRAEVRQIKSMVDRSINVTFNFPEDCTEQAKVLLDWLGLEVGLVIADVDSQIIGEELVNGSGKKRKGTVRQRAS